MKTLFLMLFISTPVYPAVVDLGTLGGNYSFARDINNSGAIAGEAKTEEGHTHAFIWQDGVMQDLGTLPGQEFSMANGMNNLGEVVGYGRGKTTSGVTKAILWEADGKAVHLPNLMGQSYSQGSEINDKGEVAGVSGTKAVKWINRKAVALPSLGGEYSIALSINNSSWVVGNSLTKEGEVHAVLWRDDEAIDLGTLGGRFSTANAINDEGQIVGSSETETGEIHAFVWQDGVMKDLGAGMIRGLNGSGLFAGESPLGDASTAILWKPATKRLESIDNAVYSSAFAINDGGLAVGVSELKAENDAEGGAAGIFHATLWRP